MVGAVEGEAGAPPEALTVAALTEFPWATASFTGQRWALPDVRLIAPIYPPKIVGIGKNYAEHAAEMGGPAPAAPLLFLRPTTAVIGPAEPIRLPVESHQVDYEGELAVVVGRLALQVPRERALDFVFGYTVGNDVTARAVDRDRAGPRRPRHPDGAGRRAAAGLPHLAAAARRRHAGLLRLARDDP